MQNAHEYKADNADDQRIQRFADDILTEDVVAFFNCENDLIGGLLVKLCIDNAFHTVDDPMLAGHQITRNNKG